MILTLSVIPCVRVSDDPAYQILHPLWLIYSCIITKVNG